LVVTVIPCHVLEVEFTGNMHWFDANKEATEPWAPKWLSWTHHFDSFTVAIMTLLIV